MNIFILDEDPIRAAKMQCDKHIPKMCAESAQMLASALRRHGATDEMMPLTKAGTPYKGGYANHPCTIWAGDSWVNFNWLIRHGMALCAEYTKRFGDKRHACEYPIINMMVTGVLLKFPPVNILTNYAQALPVELRDQDAVKAYRAYYHTKEFAKWEKGTDAPDWWQGVIV